MNSDILEFEVLHCHDGITVQEFLRNHKNISLRLIRRLKTVPNGITADNCHIRTIDTLSKGQKVKIKLPKDKITIRPVDVPLNIIYEDSILLVVNKPAFMATHSQGAEHLNLPPTLGGAITSYYIKTGQKHAFRPIGRLDRNTSGIVVCAKNTYVANMLNQNQSIDKQYLAIVSGKLEGSGVVNAPIRLKEGHGITREVGKGGKPSITKWESLYSNSDISLIRLRLKTGRTHQIRVHMQYLGHPIVGDFMYSDTSNDIDRQALHCYKSTFEHPNTKKIITLETKLPKDMRVLLGKEKSRF